MHYTIRQNALLHLLSAAVRQGHAGSILTTAAATRRTSCPRGSSLFSAIIEFNTLTFRLSRLTSLCSFAVEFQTPICIRRSQLRYAYSTHHLDCTSSKTVNRLPAPFKRHCRFCLLRTATHYTPKTPPEFGDIPPGLDCRCWLRGAMSLS